MNAIPIEIIEFLMGAPLLGLAVAAPWALLLLLGLRRTRGLAMVLAPWAALPALVAAFILPPGTELEVEWMLLGVMLGMDGITRTFLFFTALLWWLAGWFATGWFARTPGQAHFTGFYLAGMAGNLGLILAQELLSFYLFFALMSFTTYGLVIHSGKAEARYAGRVYIVLMVIGEACLFTAVALAATSVDNLRFAALREPLLGDLNLVLFALGFGIKLGTLGLHVWLPLAHPAAPVPASAVLSGAMIKAGLLGWLRVAPLGTGNLDNWGTPLIYLGLGAAFYGALVGITQTHPKTLLAYSSISQMGLMTVLVGVAMAMPEAAPAALFGIMLFALHHALAKGALFLGVGVMGTSASGQRYLAWAGLLLPALALAGAPGTSGALAKIGLSEAVTGAGLKEQLGLILDFASTATTVLMLRFLYLMHRYQSATRPQQMPVLWLSWTLLLLAVMVVPWRWPGMEEITARALLPEQVVSALWPMALGVLLVGVTICKIPPGDVLSLGRWLVDRTTRRRRGLRLRGRLPLDLYLEQVLHEWRVVGGLLVLLVIILLIVLW